jgi:hypothetical protein
LPAVARTIASRRGVRALVLENDRLASKRSCVVLYLDHKRPAVKLGLEQRLQGFCLVAADDLTT